MRMDAPQAEATKLESAGAASEACMASRRRQLALVGQKILLRANFGRSRHGCLRLRRWLLRQRLWLPFQGVLENLVDPFDRNDLHGRLDVLRNFREIFDVFFRNQCLAYSTANSRDPSTGE